MFLSVGAGQTQQGRGRTLRKIKRFASARALALPCTHISRWTSACRGGYGARHARTESDKRTLSEPAGLTHVQALMRDAPEAHRIGIADQVCAAFGFVDARGRLQRAGCLKALRSLERAGRLTLPAARTQPGRRVERRLGAAVAAPQGVGDEVTALEGLALKRRGHP